MCFNGREKRKREKEVGNVRIAIFGRGIQKSCGILKIDRVKETNPLIVYHAIRGLSYSLVTRIDSHLPRNSLENRRSVRDSASLTIVFRDLREIRRLNFTLPNGHAQNLKVPRFWWGSVSRALRL